MSQLLREYIEAVLLTEISVRTADGRIFHGEPRNIERALIRFGASKAERDAIMARQVPVSSAALAALKREKAVKPEPKPFNPKPYKERDTGRSRDAAEKKFQAAIKRFAKNWTNFTQESPDIEPEDAAHDAADGFFYENPDWEKWVRAMMVPGYDRRPKSRQEVQEIVADYVYDAMVKGRVP